MQQLIMLKGLPASGKTTWAKNWVAQDPRKRLIVSRNDIRKMLGVPIFSDRRERLVSSIESEAIRKGLKAGYNICIDAYNLNPKIERKWEKLVHSLVQSGKKVELQVIPFIRPIKDCIISDKQRPGDESVGKKLIWSLYEKFLKPKTELQRLTSNSLERQMEESFSDTITKNPITELLEPTEEDMSW